MGSAIVILSIATIFFALVMLFFNNGYKKANRFLSASLFFTAFYILTLYILLFGDSLFWSAVLVPSGPSVFFLIGPFLFLYVRSITTDNSRFGKYDFLHFVLFIVAFAGSLPFLLSSWEFKLLQLQHFRDISWHLTKFKPNIFFSTRTYQTIKPFQASFYFILIYRLIWKRFYAGDSNQSHSAQWLIIKRWLLICTSSFSLTIIAISYSMLYFLIYKNPVYFQLILPKAFLFTCCSYIVLLGSLLFFPHILYGLPIAVHIYTAEPDTKEVGLNHSQPSSNEKLITSPSVSTMESIVTTPDLTSITTKQIYTIEYIRQIEIGLHEYLADKKHLEPNCNLSSLSEYTQVPVHHLSYYFNTIKATTFPDWRNNYRIAHSITLIEDGKIENLTLNAIAQMSGFATQKTFIKAFKSKMGKTPAEYVKLKEEA